MQASNLPLKIQVPWAASGDKVLIPVPSQVAITDGRASWTTGFVPLNATPLSAGGVAPFETDFNGVLNQISAVQQWQCAGGYFKYDSAFSTAIGGYPKYAILQGATGIAYQSTVDNNITNPESGGIGWAAPQSATPPAGDRTNKQATTSMFNTEFASVLSGNGYKKIPDPNSPTGYYIEQWGVGTTSDINGKSIVTFPIAFPNACISFMPFYSAGESTARPAPTTVYAGTPLTATGGIIFTYSGITITGDISPSYRAIGY